MNAAVQDGLAPNALVVMHVMRDRGNLNSLCRRAVCKLRGGCLPVTWTMTAAHHPSQASATRAVLNGGIRLGLYDPIKTLMSADGSGRDLHMGQKLAAGSISGGIGAVLTTPIELAKTRLQVQITVNITRLLCQLVRLHWLMEWS